MKSFKWDARSLAHAKVHKLELQHLSKPSKLETIELQTLLQPLKHSSSPTWGSIPDQASPTARVQCSCFICDYGETSSTKELKAAREQHERLLTPIAADLFCVAGAVRHT